MCDGVVRELFFSNSPDKQLIKMEFVICVSGSAVDCHWSLPTFAARPWVQPESVC